MQCVLNFIRSFWGLYIRQQRIDKVAVIIGAKLLTFQWLLNNFFRLLLALWFLLLILHVGDDLRVVRSYVDEFVLLFDFTGH